MIDLHVHSTFSDGTFTPSRLLDYAMEKGLTAFALTDHDCVDGLEDLLSYHAKLLSQSGAKPVPEIIPGVELSTEYLGKDIHIVGLFLDYQNERFRQYLKDFVASRHLRNEKMCRLLADAGIDISYEKLRRTFPGAVITRAHYAKYLLQKGYVQSMKEAFERYVGDHCPYFVPREKVTPAQAVRLILEADGIPVLAHPILYKISDTHLDTLVAQLKAEGLLGIEAIYSSYAPAEERKIRRLADKYHLLLSGGSDFHGENKPGLDLGTGYGHLYVPDELLTRLKAARKNILFSDMDGTLLRSDNTISGAMKAALDRLHASGHQLVLSSGRPLPSILEVMEQTGLTYPGTLVLSYNGALVYDYDKKAPILEHRISQDDIRTLVSLADRHGLHIHSYRRDEIICRSRNEELDFYTRRIHMPLCYVADIAGALPEGSYKMQCIHLHDHTRLEHFRDSVLPLFAGRLQMIFSNAYYLEILPAGAGKGAAVRYITDFLPMPRTHTYAAGDAENDISMLQAARVGIAMKNATPQLREVADLITQNTNEEDGLLEIMERFFS